MGRVEAVDIEGGSVKVDEEGIEVVEDEFAETGINDFGFGLGGADDEEMRDAKYRFNGTSTSDARRAKWSRSCCTA